MWDLADVVLEQKGDIRSFCTPKAHSSYLPAISMFAIQAGIFAAQAEVDNLRQEVGSQKLGHGVLVVEPIAWIVSRSF